MMNCLVQLECNISVCLVERKNNIDVLYQGVCVESSSMVRFDFNFVTYNKVSREKYFKKRLLHLSIFCVRISSFSNAYTRKTFH